MNDKKLTGDLGTGWNTWNVRSVLSHVLMPEAFAISLGLKTYYQGCCLREVLIGREGKGVEKVIPGHHAYDGSYTELELAWGGATIKVETAVEDGEWYAVVTSLNDLPKKAPAVTIEAASIPVRRTLSTRTPNPLAVSSPASIAL